jgi:hypothetical protein
VATPAFGSASTFALDLCAALCDKRVDYVDVVRSDGQVFSESCEDRIATLEYEAVVLSSRDEDMTWFDAEATPQRRRHDESS